MDPDISFKFFLQIILLQDDFQEGSSPIFVGKYETNISKMSFNILTLSTL